jgi:hypothetical protein
MPTNSPVAVRKQEPVISTYTTDRSLIDPRDRETPDKKVARSSHLIRLTGKHPFNAGKSYIFFTKVYKILLALLIYKLRTNT